MKAGKVSPGPVRTLILTHLRQKEKRSLDLGRRLWQLQDPVLGDRPVFARRLALQEEGKDLPAGVDMSRTDLKLYSSLGELDVDSAPYRARFTGEDPLAASSFGFAAPGHATFILGGGNLDCCLLKTFASLIRLKSSQKESFRVAIPLALIYQANGFNDLLAYIREPNSYLQVLEQHQAAGQLGGFRIFENGRLVRAKLGPAPLAQLHWYTSLRALFASTFFPEVKTHRQIAAVMGHFCYNHD
jgi:hypothetical protein